MDIDFIGIAFYALLAIPFIILAIFVFTPVITLLIWIGGGLIMVGTVLWNVVPLIPSGIRLVYENTLGAMIEGYTEALNKDSDDSPKE